MLPGKPDRSASQPAAAVATSGVPGTAWITSAPVQSCGMQDYIMLAEPDRKRKRRISYTTGEQPPAEPYACGPSARDWSRLLAPYARASTRQALVELAVTLVLFAALWAAMALAVKTAYPWLAAILWAPAAFLVVRLFAVQHDCGHGAFFPTRLMNDWTGRVLGMITLAPYDYWQRSHAVHHATSGNLDQRGMGDVDTLTVREYLARSVWGRLRYRAYRHPLILFGFGPAYLFLLQYRLPLGAMRRAEPWISTMSTNAVIATLIVGVGWVLGLKILLLVQLPVTLLAASIGVWLFYIQHQFEDTHWDGREQWHFHDAALHGSSYYELPGVLRWATANLGVHHIHHLVSRIPLYRLNDVLQEHPELRSIGRLTLAQSLRCVRLALWDETKRRLVSFTEADLVSDRPSPPENI